MLDLLPITLRIALILPPSDKDNRAVRARSRIKWDSASAILHHSFSTKQGEAGLLFHRGLFEIMY